jgi:hypothetical protein
MTELAQASAGNTPGAESSANANAQPQPVVPSTPPAAEPSKTQAEKPVADAPNKEAAAKETPKEKKDEAPKEISLKIPDGAKLDAAHVEKIATFAKERGLSQEQAQAMLDRDAKLVSDFAAQQETTKAAWMAETETDTEVGGDKLKEASELAKRVVHRYGDKELLEELDKTGYGNNKLLVRLFSRIGRDLGEDRLVMPGSQTRDTQAPSSPAEVLYGKKK